MRKRTIIIIVLGALFLSACNFPLFGGGQDEESPEALSTAVAETVQAMNAQNDQPAMQEPDSPAASLPTLTPAPTQGQQVQLPPTQTPLPCNKAIFTGKESPADDAEFLPGEAFTKKWTFRNEGTCTWNTNYKLVFVTGDQIGGPDSVAMPVSVAPGAQVEISVDLVAPEDPGTYTGYWKLQADDIEQFGQVYVRVVTKDVLFQVTRVDYYMPHTTIDMACPGDVAIKGEITASRDGKVTYYWMNSNAVQSSTKSVTFTEAGKKIVDYTMTVAAAGDHWAKIYIDDPNHQMFGPGITFTVNCTP